MCTSHRITNVVFTAAPSDRIETYSITLRSHCFAHLHSLGWKSQRHHVDLLNMGWAWMTSVYICVSVFVCADASCVCVCVCVASQWFGPGQ